MMYFLKKIKKILIEVFKNINKKLRLVYKKTRVVHIRLGTLGILKLIWLYITSFIPKYLKHFFYTLSNARF